MMENKLPKGWTFPVLGEVVSIKSGNSSLTKKIYKEDGQYIAYSGSGPDGKVDFFEEEGDAIILSAVGARCGKCFKANGKWTTIANTSVIRTFLDNQKHIDYIFYLLNNENFWPRGGTGQPFVKTGKAQKEIKVPLPPLPEQYRIVAKLDALMQKVESNKQRLDKIPAILKRFRQSVLAAAVSGVGDEVYSKEVCSIIQIGPFGTQLHKHDYVKNGIPLINPMHIQNGLVVEDMNYSITTEKFNSLSNYHLKIGDVIMGRRGEMARCALITKRENAWLCGTGSLFFRPNELILPEYLFLSLSNLSTKEFLESESLGTTMSNLNLGIANKIPINLPSIDKQKKIIEAVHFLIKLADKIEARYTKAKAMMDKLPQSILAKAFRGELVPQDPNDEPAERLLERILIEKKTKIKVTINKI